MRKFKVGDRVRVTSPADDFNERPESCAGMTGEITEIWEDCCDVRLSKVVGKYRSWGFELSELSPIESDASADPTTLTRRDRFAIAALTGLCADSGTAGVTTAVLAKTAYAIADAMEAARNKEGGE